MYLRSVKDPTKTTLKVLLDCAWPSNLTTPTRTTISCEGRGIFHFILFTFHMCSLLEYIGMGTLTLRRNQFAILNPISAKILMMETMSVATLVLVI